MKFTDKLLDGFITYEDGDDVGFVNAHSFLGWVFKSICLILIMIVVSLICGGLFAGFIWLVDVLVNH